MFLLNYDLDLDYVIKKSHVGTYIIIAEFKNSEQKKKTGRYNHETREHNYNIIIYDNIIDK